MSDNELKIGDVKGIIKLYKQFSQYGRNTPVELLNHILPSLGHKQYKLNKDNNEVIGFASWAFLNEEAENRFKKTGKIKPADWKSGKNFWQIDVLSSKGSKKFFKEIRQDWVKLLGLGTKISWVKLDNDKVKRVQSTKTKEIWR